ncbi:MAG: D-alanine--D-alanine ligase family protein [Acidimicrobiales bacterium]
MSRPAVVFGGPSPEHDVSILTGLHAARALALSGREPFAVYWTKAGDWFRVDPDLEARDFLEGVPRGARALRLVGGTGGGGFVQRRRPLDISVAVNCCHGGPGEDGTLQAAFDLAGVRATGPPVAAAALGMDKLAFGATVAAAGLPSLPRELLADGDWAPSFPPPYIVKPRFGGSSLGIEVVDDLFTAQALSRTSPHLRHGAVVEPFLPDSRDLNVAVCTYPELRLSAIEAPIRTGSTSEIFSYETKYLAGGLERAPRELPADIPRALSDRIGHVARRVVTLVGVRSVARLDFLLDGERLLVNEINTIPGSLASYLWVDPPIPFPELLDSLIAESRESGRRALTTAGADGSLLRAAGSIASKLA